MTREVFEEDRFEAVSEAGKTYTVVKLRHMSVYRPFSGPAQKSMGNYEWKTACGIDLDEKADGRFEMIQIDGFLRRK